MPAPYTFSDMALMVFRMEVGADLRVDAVQSELDRRAEYQRKINI